MRVQASRKRKALFLNQQPRITKFFPSAGSPAMPTELSIEQVRIKTESIHTTPIDSVTLRTRSKPPYYRPK
jgi:hypothetical protein